MKVTVIGAGAFGTALANRLAQNHHEVMLWALETKVRDEITRLHQNLTFLPDIQLDTQLKVTSALEAAYGHSEIIFLVPPFFALRGILPKNGQGKVFICCSKGIEKDSHLLAFQIVEEVVSEPTLVAALSGPSFAREVGLGVPTKVVLAARADQELPQIAKLLRADNFKVETSRDIVGVELGGALKNVSAILAGLSSGLGQGKNLQALLFTEGLKEIVRLGEKLGAKESTFYSISGVGDLFLTSTSDQSRNFTFGFRLGQGEKAAQILQAQNVFEGRDTTEAAYHLAQAQGVSAPLLAGVYQVIFEDKDPNKALKDIWGAL